MLVLYDGNCGFCSAIVSLAKRSSDGIIFEPLQSETGQLWLSKLGGVDSLIVVRGENAYIFSDAVIEILLHLGRAYKLLGYLLKLIPKPLRDWGYKIVARNRHCDFF